MPTIEDITPAIMVKNEEFWIYYVLQDIVKIFPKILILDTGSTDFTKKIIKYCGRNKVELIEEDYKDYAVKIGNGRNVLREKIQTEWMFLIDGDEVWAEPQIKKLLETNIPNDKLVCMAGSRNIQDRQGQLYRRTQDTACKDVLFRPSVRWKRLDYPFEGYGLDNDLPKESVFYFNCDEVFCHHMRHTKRSRLDHQAYFRNEKMEFFPYDGPFEEFKIIGQDPFKVNPYCIGE